MKNFTMLAGIGLTFFALAQASPSQTSDLRKEVGELLRNSPNEPAATDNRTESNSRLKDGLLIIDNGRIEIFKRNTLTIAAERPGTLNMVEPNQEGAMVEKSQTVARLKDDEPRSALEVAKRRAENTVEIEYAESVNDVNQATLEKAEASNRRSRGVFTELEMKEKKLEVRRSALQIKKAREDKIIAGLERDQAAAVLTAYELKSEIAGEVTEVMKRSGEAVAQGDPIMTIMDLSTMKCVAEVEPRHSHMVRKGTRLTVRIEIPGEKLPIEEYTFPGRVTFIRQSVGQLSQKKSFHAEIQNKRTPDGEFILRENLKVKILIPTT